MDENEIFQNLTNFIYAVRWKYKQPLTYKTRLYEDLKIDGDDAIDFFSEFQKTFGLELSKFVIEKHFNGEGFDPIGFSILLRLFSKQKKSNIYDKKISINLGHLVKAIKIGRLDEEIINS